MSKEKRDFQMKLLITQEERKILRALSAIEGKTIQELFRPELESLLKKAEEKGIKLGGDQ